MTTEKNIGAEKTFIRSIKKETILRQFFMPIMVFFLLIYKGDDLDLVTTVIGVFLGLVCILSGVKAFVSMDEFEKSISGKSAHIALLSSLLIIPVASLVQGGFLTEISPVFGFLFIWFVYLGATIYFTKR